MDQRVLRTKNALKSALLCCVKEKDFDSVNVAELCNKANINRVTFYTHYHDKYELLDDIFQDMDKAAVANSSKLDATNNPKKDDHIKYVNYLQAFIENLANYEALIYSMSKNQSGYVYFAFKSYFNSKLRDLLLYFNQEKNLIFPLEQTTAFLTYGFIGFIIEGMTLKKSCTDVFLDAYTLFHKLIDNNVFLKK